MLPYNQKVWAFPPEMMSAGWVGERVAVTDLNRVLRSIDFGIDDVSWGPNNTFQFPRTGGTGRCVGHAPPSFQGIQLIFNTVVMRVDLSRREVFTADGRTL